jgi:zinc protease
MVRLDIRNYARALMMVTAVFVSLIAASTRPDAKVFDPKTFTLANGLQVVVIPNHRAPIVIQMVWYKIGAADEPEGKSGIAHFLEHLMFKGTKTVPPGEFSKIVARNGGQDNAFTSQDYTAYFQRVAKHRLELVMRLEADRMTGLTLSDKEVLPERDVVLEERRSRTDNNPGAQLHEQSQATLYLHHPYGDPVIGWKSEIESLTTQDAMAWYRKYYTPNNAVLIIAGDVTVDEIKPLAEKYYGPIRSRPVPPRVRLTEPPHLAARRVVLKSPLVRQPSWSRTFIAPSSNTAKGGEASALQVLAEILGGGPTSRLYRALIVEGKVAASAGAWYSSSALDLGSFGLSGSPRPGGGVEKVEAAMAVEIKRLLADGVSEEEVARAKKSLRAGAVFVRDSLGAGPNILGRALTTGRTIADVESWPERIGAVTREQVDAAARAVLQDKKSVTSVLLPEPRS